MRDSDTAATARIRTAAASVIAEATTKGVTTMKNSVYGIILKAPDGRQRRVLAWFPTEECRQDFYDKARKRGLEIDEYIV
jgi:hypothetical protein